jgi:hypothetical protein
MGRHESEEASIWALTSFRVPQELTLTLRPVSECDVKAPSQTVADSLAFGTWMPADAMGLSRAAIRAPGKQSVDERIGKQRQI